MRRWQTSSRRRHRWRRPRLLQRWVHSNHRRNIRFEPPFRVQFAPRAALLVKRGAPVPAFFAAHRDRARAVHGDTHAGGRVRALGRTRAVDRVVVDAARGTVGARTERHAIVSSSVIAVLFA